MQFALGRRAMPPSAKAALGLLLLVGLGLLGNLAHFPIFLNIDFLFGSIFAMLALQLLGWRLGVLAAALIGSYTYVLWNHPYAALIATAEVATVGWLVQRHRIGLVLADALYWVVLGTPCTYLLYGQVLDVPMASVALVVVKQCINGIANTLLARLAFSAYVFHKHKGLVALREVSYNLLTFFALCPALILLAIASHNDVAEADHHIRRELVADDQRLQVQLAHWLQERTDSVVYISQLAAAAPGSNLQSQLDQARLSDSNFLRVGLLDADATVLQYSPTVDELGAANVGKNFSDRPFSLQVRQASKPFLSEVVMGRMGTPEPIVTLLAPVRRQGRYAGYVSGVLSLAHLRDYLEKSLHHPDLRYLVLDRHGTVILGNWPEFPTLSHFERPLGHRNNYGDGSFGWTPRTAGGKPTMEQWKSSWYVTESHVNAMGDWQLVLEQPVAPIQAMLSDRYTRLLASLLLLLLLALALAEWISRKSIATLNQLSELTNQLPDKLSQGPLRIRWPSTGIAEIHGLIKNFRVMAVSLSAQVINERSINNTLDALVVERTAALSESLQEKEALLREVHHRVKNNLQVITSILRLESGRSDNPASIAVLQDMQDRVRAMALLHETIYRTGTFSAVDLGDYLRQVASQTVRALQTGSGHVQLHLNLGELRVSLDQATPFGLLTNELLSNSFKHAFPNGRGGDIWVELQPTHAPQMWRLQVRDNGAGLPQDLEARRASGLGLKLVAGLAGQIGGQLEIGPAAQFTVVFSSAAAAPIG